MENIKIIAFNLVKEVWRKKDIYVLFFLLLILLLFLANTSFFGLSDIERYLKEVGLGMVFLFSLLLAVPFTAKLMIEEIREKTIFPLLAKPVTRLQLILGKYLGAVLVSVFSFSLFYGVFLMANILHKDTVRFLLYFQVYLFGALLFIVLDALVLWFSVQLTFSATIAISYAIYFLMSWFGTNLRLSLEKLNIFGELVYYLLPHFELFDLRHRLIHLWPVLPLWVVITVVIYAFLYGALLLWLAYLGFKKKWL